MTFPESSNDWAFTSILANKNKKIDIFFILKNFKTNKKR
jgi:hypothetical protein